MIVYVNTSAFVPLLFEEPTSQTCGALWDLADRLVTTRLTHVEAAAALATAQRLGRITGREQDAGLERLNELWPEFNVVELDEQLMTTAAQAAMTHGLRGYDSVHFAAAATVNDKYLVAASGDVRLLDAWSAASIAVVDTNAATPEIP